MNNSLKPTCFRSLLALVLGVFLASTANLSYGHWGEDWWFEYCWFDFIDEVQLSASSSAPAGAFGWARLESSPDDSGPSLYVNTRGLAADTYTVSITETTGATIVLGTFTSSATNDNDFDRDDTDRGRGEFVLPSGVATTDVASVTITDSTNVIMLSGTFAVSTTTTLDGDGDSDGDTTGGGDEVETGWSYSFAE
jgi:hypothetical protein